MFNGVGFIVILVCVFGSFLLAGGKMDIILHALPHEMMAIGGAAVGSFLIANSLDTVKLALKGLTRSFKAPRWKESDYNDLLAVLFTLLTIFRTGGATAIEKHLDEPHDNPLFSKYPRLLADHHLIEFVCDYLRMMTVNFDDPHQLAEAMENDIERHHHEELLPQHALQTMADGLNQLGVSPRDLIIILQALKSAGALQAEIEVQ